MTDRRRFVVLRALLGWATLLAARPALTRAQPASHEAGEHAPIYLAFEGDWPSALRADLSAELAVILVPRRVRHLDARAALTPRVDLAYGAPIGIRVFRSPAPAAARETLVFDLSRLPADTHAFALARAIYELLQQAQVISAKEATADVPAEPARAEVARAAGPAALLAEERSVPPSSLAPSQAIKWTLGARPRAAVTTADTVWWGGGLFVHARGSLGTLSLDLHAETASAVESRRGTVGLSAFGATTGALVHLIEDGSFRVSAGPLVSAAAFVFQGRPATAASAGETVAAPALLAGGRVASEFLLAPPLVMLLAVDAQGAVLGAQAVDDAAAIVKIDGAFLVFSLGLGVEL